jgi:WD40 repeat protein
VAFVPGSQALASAYEDGTVVLWNPATGKERSRLRPTLAVKSVAFAPDGKTLASAGGSEVKLWDVDAATPEKK